MTHTVDHDADGNLLIECDSILSLIRYREKGGLSEQTLADLDHDLLSRLRARTDALIRERRTRPIPSEKSAP
jgi:hypothetical protein